MSEQEIQELRRHYQQSIRRQQMSRIATGSDDAVIWSYELSEMLR